ESTSNQYRIDSFNIQHTNVNEIIKFVRSHIQQRQEEQLRDIKYNIQQKHH
ncbi:unnamed protein product, partial [Rotaria sp. Silwood2]